MYDSKRKIVVFSQYAKNPIARPQNAWRNAAPLNKHVSPMSLPYLPKIGPNINAAMLAMPITSPYCVHARFNRNINQ